MKFIFEFLVAQFIIGFCIVQLEMHPTYK